MGTGGLGEVWDHDDFTPSDFIGSARDLKLDEISSVRPEGASSSPQALILEGLKEDGASESTLKLAGGEGDGPTLCGGRRNPPSVTLVNR